MTGAVVSDDARAELARVGAARFTARDYRPGIVRHIVLFRFAAGLLNEEVAALVRQFHDLALTSRDGGDPYILSIESGLQSSPEGADHGFERAFIVSFASEGDRNYYAGRPLMTDNEHLDVAHDAFKAAVEPALADVLVFDFQV